MNDAVRAQQNLLTVGTVDQLVTECIGVVQVMAIVGRCRSGKTWAARDWLNARQDKLQHGAYVDCKGIGFGRDGVVAFDGVERDLREGHYPRFALDGVDVVVVDEPRCDPELVKQLLTQTAPQAGTAGHQLVVLLLQDTLFIDELGLRPAQVRCYSVAGLPIPIR